MISLTPLTGVWRSFFAGSSPDRRIESLVGRIQEDAVRLRESADTVLRQRTLELRQAVRCGADPDSHSILIPSFALVLEGARRAIGIGLFDVQIQAGIILARRSIAEMATGEGKTFAAAFPAFLHALAGRGVHVMTVNTYLAERDHDLLAPLFQLLGMSTGLLRPQLSLTEKRHAYTCDITYGPGYEFGFDYLRDQLLHIDARCPSLGEGVRDLFRGTSRASRDPVQRDRAFAIVDEADSVMLDEATTPLILAGGLSGTHPKPEIYLEAQRVSRALVEGHDFNSDPVSRTVRLSDRGARTIVELLTERARTDLQRTWRQYVEQTLTAHLYLRRDVDYIVSDGQVKLVDQNTGRIFTDRTLPLGLHQAVEAKEGLAITSELDSQARISRQRFFLRYDGICGMTGTARGSERELSAVYGMTVVPIPTRLPCRRQELATRYFVNQESKWDAVVSEIESVHRRGQPILVGTRTIENSELLAARLSGVAVSHRLLNGRQDEAEASIVARAGEAGTVTIATNMAGRGTDIRLGLGVAELGGLHVIGTERHESSRVDRQLAGRAARQGDPGSCRFFVAADDSLLTRHAPWLSRHMKQLADSRGELNVDLSCQIAVVQQEAERWAFEQRRRLYVQDEWIEKVMARLFAEGRTCSA